MKKVFLSTAAIAVVFVAFAFSPVEKKQLYGQCSNSKRNGS